ncbi:hypothetical protein GJ496_000172 [Pomphorhynchus laevis]|nr:hypothetical protein GJ496_000172 [Pomphorhynchus laevis]
MAFWNIFNDSSSHSESMNIDDFLKPYIVYDQHKKPMVNKYKELPSIDELLAIDNLGIDLKTKNEALITFITYNPILNQILNRAFKQSSGVTPTNEQDLTMLDKFAGMCNNDNASAINGSENGDANRSSCPSIVPSEDVKSNDLCFEIISCENPAIVKCLLEEHFENIAKVLDIQKLDAQLTDRFCRVLINLINYNEEALQHQLNKYNFIDKICKHLTNSSLLECMAQSRLISIMNIQFTSKLVNTVFDYWAADLPIAHSSLELIVHGTCSVLSSTPSYLSSFNEIFPLQRIVDQIFTKSSETEDNRLKEVCVNCLIKLCDSCLPWPFLAVDNNAIEKQIQIDEVMVTQHNGDDDHDKKQQRLDLILSIFSDDNNRQTVLNYISCDPSNVPKMFTNFRYLWLCLFLRIIALVSTTTNCADDNNPLKFSAEQINNINIWLRYLLKDHVIPVILVRWPLHHRAHDVVVKLARISIQTDLFKGNERTELAQMCLQQWFNLDENQLVQQYCSWSYWSMLIRLICPSEMLSDSKDNMVKRFLWNEHIYSEKKTSFNKLVPVTFQSFTNSIMFATHTNGGWYYEEQDDSDDLNIADNRSGFERESDVDTDTCDGQHNSTNSATGVSVDDTMDSNNMFDNLWWTSPEDIIPDFSSIMYSSSNEDTQSSEDS